MLTAPMPHVRRAARRSIVSFVAISLLTVPAVVLASHQFPDVPDSNQFHDDIGAIAEAGITAGFGDGGYHPSDPVTRQAMAAFMHRGFGGANWLQSSLAGSVNVGDAQTVSPDVLVRSLDVTVPGQTNAFSPTQFVYLQGQVTFASPMNAAQGCPCEFVAQIKDLTSNTVSAQYETFESAWNLFYKRTMYVDAMFEAAPGPRTFELRTWLTNRGDGTNSAVFPISTSSTFSIMSFPFRI